MRYDDDMIKVNLGGEHAFLHIDMQSYGMIKKVIFM